MIYVQVLLENVYNVHIHMNKMKSIATKSIHEKIMVCI